MDSGYVNVVDVWDLIWTLVVYLLHGALVFAQAGLACFLLGTGAANVLTAERDTIWLRRLGVTGIGSPRARLLGALRIALGLLLLAPLALGAPMPVALAAAVAAFALLFATERGLIDAERPRGRRLRRAALAGAALAALFMVWEREDNLALGADLLVHAMEWRNEEIAWQQSLDPKSPKVGDLAPDFELQDPEGRAAVRLSDFRGKRPVALVFGSYT